MNSQRAKTLQEQNGDYINNFNLQAKNNFSIKGSSLLGDLEHKTNMFKKDLSLSKDFVVIEIDFKRATLREASNFKSYIEKVIQQEEKNIIVNLNKCEFIDSSFFGVLVATFKRLKAMQKDFYLVYSDNHQLPIFSATGLDKIFSVFNSVEEAITKS